MNKSLVVFLFFFPWPKFISNTENLEWFLTSAQSLGNASLPHIWRMLQHWVISSEEALYWEKIETEILEGQQAGTFKEPLRISCCYCNYAARCVGGRGEPMLPCMGNSRPITILLSSALHSLDLYLDLLWEALCHNGSAGLLFRQCNTNSLFLVEIEEGMRIITASCWFFFPRANASQHAIYTIFALQKQKTMSNVMKAVSLSSDME